MFYNEIAFGESRLLSTFFALHLHRCDIDYTSAPFVVCRRRAASTRHTRREGGKDINYIAMFNYQSPIVARRTIDYADIARN